MNSKFEIKFNKGKKAIHTSFSFPHTFNGIELEGRTRFLNEYGYRNDRFL